MKEIFGQKILEKTSPTYVTNCNSTYLKCFIVGQKKQIINIIMWIINIY
jgi:hypothetical protein